MDRVLTAFLTHQAPAQVGRMLDYWRKRQEGLRPFVVHGGSRQDFEALDGSAPAVFVDDPRLRTVDHPRDRQSYLGVFKRIAEHLAGTDCEAVHFVEYDEVPVVDDVQHVLASRMEQEGADLLACGLVRIDGTNNPHFLSHAYDPAFGRYWQSISRRRDKGTVLSALGCGMFWRRETFLDVSELEESLPIYLEILLPTAAHHLGYRVRPLAGQYAFMHPDNRYRLDEIDALRDAGALCAHPFKDAWLGGV